MMGAYIAILACILLAFCAGYLLGAWRANKWNVEQDRAIIADLKKLREGK